MKVFLSVFLLCLIASCDLPQLEDSPYAPNKETLANDVTNKAIAQLKMEKDLYSCGIGAGMMDKIRMLALSFNYYKEVDINQARELLVSSGTLFLNIINANEQIHPYLKNNPFKPENIEIRIFLKKPNGSKHELDKLTVITLIHGLLTYKVRCSEADRLTIIYEETFEEATAKLRNTESPNPSM